MDAPIRLIFSGANIAKAIGAYFGVIETIDVKLDKLIRSELDAGLRALDQAARSQKEEVSLLREARMRLNKAISLETKGRLISAYIALALCHYHLGDKNNAYDTLRCIEDVNTDENVARTAMGALDTIALFPVSLVTLAAAGKTPGQIALDMRQKSFTEIKESVRNYLNSVS